jgi:hypothetical protein
LEQLQARIAARFPESGLERVCLTLSTRRAGRVVDASELARPNWLLRGGVAAWWWRGLLALVWLLRL